MNSRTTIFALAAALVLGSLPSIAGDRLTDENIKYYVNFRATCRTTTDDGRIVTRVISNKDIIRHCLKSAGLSTTNLNSYRLIYDQNSDYNGDTIKVVRRSDGSAICQPFRVLFQRSITDLQGPRDERIGSIFNGPNTDPMGSVIVTERANAGTGRITGRFQMWDEIYYPERNGICTGSFVTGSEVNW